jgi:hypothetical protein
LSFSALNNQFFAHGSENSDEALFLALLEDSLDHIGDIFQVILRWDVNIRFHLTLSAKKLELFVIDVQKGVLNSLDDWGIDHITSVISALVLFHGKNILSLEDDLSGSVLTWFGSSDIGNLAWETLNHDEGTWLESIGIGLLTERGTSVSNLKSFVLV